MAATNGGSTRLVGNAVLLLPLLQRLSARPTKQPAVARCLGRIKLDHVFVHHGHGPRQTLRCVITASGRVMETDSSLPAGFVRLRVGGETFEASRDVLLSEPGSVFVAILAGEWAQAQSPSCIGSARLVFDRDPQASSWRCLSADATRCTRFASVPLHTHAGRAPSVLTRVRLRGHMAALPGCAQLAALTRARVRGWRVRRGRQGRG